MPPSNLRGNSLRGQCSNNFADGREAGRTGLCRDGHISCNFYRGAAHDAVLGVAGNRLTARPLLSGIHGDHAGDHGSVEFRCAPAFPKAPTDIVGFALGCVYSAAMEDTPKRVTDHLYWRKARKQWHCFKKIAQVRGYVSLCQRQEIAVVRGRAISRPEATLRCGVCDGLEMERRGWEGSGPVSLRRSISR
jgi:hypothetical protein